MRKEAEKRAERERKRQEAQRAAAEAKRNGYPMSETIHVGYTSYRVWNARWSDRLSPN